jgi:hypothetical protein
VQAHPIVASEIYPHDDKNSMLSSNEEDTPGPNPSPTPPI